MPGNVSSKIANFAHFCTSIYGRNPSHQDRQLRFRPVFDRILEETYSEGQDVRMRSEKGIQERRGVTGAVKTVPTARSGIAKPHILRGCPDLLLPFL